MLSSPTWRARSTYRWLWWMGPYGLACRAPVASTVPVGSRARQVGVRYSSGSAAGVAPSQCGHRAPVVAALDAVGEVGGRGQPDDEVDVGCEAAHSAR